MIAPVQEFERSFAEILGLKDTVITYSLMFLFGLVVLPLSLGWLATLLTRALANTNDTLHNIFKRYALGLFPVSFGMWIAHYLYHFLIGGLGIIPAFQNFFVKMGIPVFGQPDWAVSTVIPRDWLGAITPMQVLIVYVGFMISGVSIWQISHKMYKRKVAGKAALPFLFLTLLIAVFGILILLQPMQARGTFGA
jgi:hypothetical protein